jgi:hypothetical protein
MLALGVMCLALAQPAFAVRHSIDFDTYPNGAPTSVGDSITTQYPGASFPDVPAPVIVQPRQPTSSPPHALASSLVCNAVTCPAHRLPVNFSPAVSDVSLTAGLDYQNEGELGGTWARLVGYSGPNGTGSVVAQSYNPLSEPPGPDFRLEYPITTRISMTSFSGQPNIASAVLYEGQDTALHDAPEPRAVRLDDLTYTDDVSPLPPDPGPPSVQITVPGPNTYVQSPEDAKVSGVAQAPAGLDRFCLAVDSRTTMPPDCQNLAGAVQANGSFFNVHVPGFTAGRHTVTAWVRDVRNRTASATITIEAATAGGGVDVRVQNIEVTQGTQFVPMPGPFFTTVDAPGIGPHPATPYNGVNLAAGGKTIVRVYADAASLGRLNRPDVHGVRLLLFGFRGSTSLGPPLPPDTGPRDLRLGPAAVGQSDRLSATGAYTFTLPAAWTSGTIRLIAELNPSIPPTVVECGGCAANNIVEVSNVHFTPMRPIFITPVAMTHPSGESVVGISYVTDPVAAFDGARNVTPLGDGQFHVLPYGGLVDVTAILRCDPADVAHGWCTGNLNNDLLGALNAWRGSHSFRGKAYGLGYGIGGVTRIPDYALADPTQRPLSSIAHELFHMFGLRHAGRQPTDCGGDSNGQVGTDWPPDQMGQLQGFALDRRSGSGGRAAEYRIVGGPGTSTVPVTDFMSYCNAFLDDPATWVSPRNWNAVLDGLRVGGSLGGWGGETRATAGPAAATMLHVMVTLPSGHIERVEQIQGSPTAPATDSAYKILVRNTAGKVIQDLPVAVQVAHADHELPPASLEANVPASAAASLVVTRFGKTLDVRRRTPHAPVVQILSPRPGSRIADTGWTTVRWHVSDEDGDPAIVRVDYSADGGRTYQSIAVNVTESSIKLPTSFFTRSSSARVRITASDGFNETSAVSKPFSAAGRAPLVRITSPRGRRVRIASEGSLYLSGEAYDEYEGFLQPSRLKWYDGRRLLGRGAVLNVRGLRPGIQKIRLVAGGSFGRIGSAKANVIVKASRPAFLTLVAPRFVGRNARTLTLRVSANLPAKLTVGRQRFSVGVTPRSVQIGIKQGKYPAVLHLRLTAYGRTTSASLTILRQ